MPGEEIMEASSPLGNDGLVHGDKKVVAEFIKKTEISNSAGDIDLNSAMLGQDVKLIIKEIFDTLGGKKEGFNISEHPSTNSILIAHGFPLIGDVFVEKSDKGIVAYVDGDQYLSLVKKKFQKQGNEINVQEGKFHIKGELIEDIFTHSISINTKKEVKGKGRKGGIDLNSAMLDLQIRRDGNGVPLPISQQPIADMRIDGFLPVIINVTPIINNLPLLLGVVDSEDDEGAGELSYKLFSDPMDTRRRSESGGVRT